jgi:argininosuccinate lyase
MENTGRILRGLTPTARRIIFGSATNPGSSAELAHISHVDRAHLVMLAECGIIERDVARAVLTAIDQLRATDFAALHGRAAPRGLFLLYENYLIEQLGATIGGVLQTARSRNDLNATILRMRLREPYLHLLREALRFQAILLRRARRFATVTMPIYTHYQAALPVTYGHYLAGIAEALERDITSLIAASAELHRCPLGAGAVGGTSFPIDPARTAALLGFTHPVSHSIDAVASRDTVLRLLSAATILGVTLSRLASDLLLWTTAEFAFLTVPDELVGSSSMMPQKRNPFLLEHVLGRSAAPLGSFVASATAMHAKPFTNTIAVGTEAVAPVWRALENITEALILARLVVAGATPQPEPMIQRAEAGYVSATELANRLVAQGQMSFRSAHHAVGTIVRDALDRGNEPLQEAAARHLAAIEPPIAADDLDPSAVAQASAYGGGPGAAALEACLGALQSRWSDHMRQMREQARTWQAAETTLDAAVGSL